MYSKLIGTEIVNKFFQGFEGADNSAQVMSVALQATRFIGERLHNMNTEYQQRLHLLL
jgi:hypothetical protein